MQKRRGRIRDLFKSRNRKGLEIIREKESLFRSLKRKRMAVNGSEGGDAGAECPLALPPTPSFSLSSLFFALFLDGLSAAKKNINEKHNYILKSGKFLKK